MHKASEQLVCEKEEYVMCQLLKLIYWVILVHLALIMFSNLFRLANFHLLVLKNE